MSMIRLAQGFGRPMAARAGAIAPAGAKMTGQQMALVSSMAARNPLLQQELGRAQPKIWLTRNFATAAADSSAGGAAPASSTVQSKFVTDTVPAHKTQRDFKPTKLFWFFCFSPPGLIVMFIIQHHLRDEKVEGDGQGLKFIAAVRAARKDSLKEYNSLMWQREDKREIPENNAYWKNRGGGHITKTTEVVGRPGQEEMLAKRAKSFGRKKSHVGLYQSELESNPRPEHKFVTKTKSYRVDKAAEESAAAGLLKD